MVKDYGLWLITDHEGTIKKVLEGNFNDIIVLLDENENYKLLPEVQYVADGKIGIDMVQDPPEDEMYPITKTGEYRDWTVILGEREARWGYPNGATWPDGAIIGIHGPDGSTTYGHRLHPSASRWYKYTVREDDTLPMWSECNRNGILL